jgi:gamma-glutamyltranspeptidase/glutathione hydrolase
MQNWAMAGALALVLGASVPAYSQQASDTLAPESASGTEEKQVVKANRQMVVAANPLAAQAGLDILRQGGSGPAARVGVPPRLCR